MTAPVFRDATRENVALVVALAGATGSGKTMSALKVARGLAGGRADMTGEELATVDAKIAVIDTERGRALHYAPPKGQLPTASTFGFKYLELAPPFSPERYSEAIEAADAAGFAVILVDSMTHEYAGEGGITEIHDDEVAKAVERARGFHGENSRYAFDADKAADKASVGAWNGPKTRHKKMVGRLLTRRAHVVLCLRAEEKLRMELVKEQGSNGKTYTKTVITQAKDLPPNERWVPVQEKSFMYEMTLSCVLSPSAPGVPIPIKLNEQHVPAVPLDRPLSEWTGRALAAWSRGGSDTKKVEPAKAKEPAPADKAEGPTLIEIGEENARQGTAVYAAWIKSLSKVDRVALRPHFPRLDELAELSDAGEVADDE